MRPDEIQSCLDALRWSPQTLADDLGCDLSAVEAWLDGSDKIPPKTKVWLYVLSLAHQAVNKEKPKTIRGKKLNPKPARQS